jgi:hypothetical protein
VGDLAKPCPHRLAQELLLAAKCSAKQERKNEFSQMKEYVDRRNIICLLQAPSLPACLAGGGSRRRRGPGRSQGKRGRMQPQLRGCACGAGVWRRALGPSSSGRRRVAAETWGGR